MAITGWSIYFYRSSVFSYEECIIDFKVRVDNSTCRYFVHTKECNETQEIHENLTCSYNGTLRCNYLEPNSDDNCFVKGTSQTDYSSVFLAIIFTVFVLIAAFSVVITAYEPEQEFPEEVVEAEAFLRHSIQGDADYADNMFQYASLGSEIDGEEGADKG
jgi:hypothetical protein